MAPLQGGFIIMNHHWFSAIALASLVACSSGAGSDDPAATADAIVGGRSDTKDAAVVAIDIGGEALCTGSLIGPRLVLTARHCVSETSEAVDCPAQSSQIEGERAADTFTILVGSDIRTARAVAIGQRVITPDSDVLCDHDVALIELDRDVTGITPLALGSLSGVKTVRGVGFGKRGFRRASARLEGARRRRRLPWRSELQRARF
jgi:Trypsin